MKHTRRGPLQAPNSYGIRALPDRAERIVGATIHETRSGHPDGDDGPGAEAWASSHANCRPGGNGEDRRCDWCSMWDILIYEDGTQVIMFDIDENYAAWTAGWGAAGDGTWPMGIPYIQVEFAHGTGIEPYSAAQVDSGAQLFAELSYNYDFPLVRVPFVTQTEEVPPRGITTHKDCANGVKLGKSDPGDSFPWDSFLALARRYREALEPDTSPSLGAIAELNEAVSKRIELNGLLALHPSLRAKLSARSHLMDWVADDCETDAVPSSLAAGGWANEYAVMLRAWDWANERGWIPARS